MSNLSISIFALPASKYQRKRLNFHQVGEAEMGEEEQEAYSQIVDRQFSPLTFKRRTWRLKLVSSIAFLFFPAFCASVCFCSVMTFQNQGY